MEFASDLLAGLRSRVQGAPDRGALAGIDWPGLHARLAAAHAARVQLASFESPRGGQPGGFENWQRLAPTSGKYLPDVNRTDLADGKSAGAMMAASPDDPSPAAEESDD